MPSFETIFYAALGVIANLILWPFVVGLAVAKYRSSLPPPSPRFPTNIYGAPLSHVSHSTSRDRAEYHETWAVRYDTQNRLTPQELAAYKLTEARRLPRRPTAIYPSNRL
jgi:hypothetical protein